MKLTKSTQKPDTEGKTTSHDPEGRRGHGARAGGRPAEGTTPNPPAPHRSTQLRVPTAQWSLYLFLGFYRVAKNCASEWCVFSRHPAPTSTQDLLQ